MARLARLALWHWTFVLCRSGALAFCCSFVRPRGPTHAAAPLVWQSNAACRRLAVESIRTRGQRRCLRSLSARYVVAGARVLRGCERGFARNRGLDFFVADALRATAPHTLPRRRRHLSQATVGNGWMTRSLATAWSALGPAPLAVRRRGVRVCAAWRALSFVGATRHCRLRCAARACRSLRCSCRSHDCESESRH